MAIANRITRLLRADIHSLLDRLEDPRALLRQALKDMRDALEEDCREMERHRRSMDMIGHRRRLLAADRTRLEEDIIHALTHGNETTARSLARRNLDTEERMTMLDQQARELDERISSFRTRIAANRRRLVTISDRARREVPPPGIRPEWPCHGETGNILPDEIDLARFGTDSDRGSVSCSHAS